MAGACKLRWWKTKSNISSMLLKTNNEDSLKIPKNGNFSQCCKLSKLAKILRFGVNLKNNSPRMK